VEAAARGALVTLVTDASVTTSGSTFSRLTPGWGIQALMKDEYTPQHAELFYNEIVSVGKGICDPTLARILVEASGRRVEDLIGYGIRFIKEDDGRYFRATGCFSTTQRALITANMGNVKQALLSKLQQHRVRIVTGMVIDLAMRDTTCEGAFVFSSGSKLFLIRAKATIMAAGGGGAIYEHHLCSPECTGDAYAVAHRAGAQLASMAFIQFMLGLERGHERQFLPRDLLSQQNILVDANGTAILERCLPDRIQRDNAVRLRLNHCPASSCDLSFAIDRSVALAARETGTVFWNADLNDSDGPEVVHMAHAFNGGICINARAASTLPGLFAAGEAAAGPHGADRIGGCMMTATQVFGQRAGQFAARRAAKLNRVSNDLPNGKHLPVIKSGCPSGHERETLDQIAHAVKRAMHTHVNVLRSRRGLESCRRLLLGAACRLASMEGASRDNYIRFNKVRNMIDTARQVVRSALDRKHSLGAHFREDEAALSSESEGNLRLDSAA
jgi:L-aspartate oxidase